MLIAGSQKHSRRPQLGRWPGLDYSTIVRCCFGTGPDGVHFGVHWDLCQLFFLAIFSALSWPAFSAEPAFLSKMFL